MAHEEPRGEEHDWSGLSLTTAAFLFLVLRLFAVVDYNWHSAFAVLHTLDLDDAIGIVLGTLMANSAAAAVFLAVLLPAALFRMLIGRRRAQLIRAEGQEDHRGAEGLDLSGPLLVAIALVGVSAYVGTFDAWWLIAVTVAVGVLFFGVGYAEHAGGRIRVASRWVASHVGGLMVGALLLSAATVSTPWMPLEKLETSGHGTLRGYVLETEPGFVKFLTEEDREFLILLDKEVTSRAEVVEH